MSKKVGLASLLIVLGVIAGCKKDQDSASAAAAKTPAAPPAAPAAPVDSLSKNLAADKFFTQTGHLVEGRLVNNGKNGYLLYGPYTPVLAGTYAVEVKGKIEELPPGGKVRLGMDSGRGKATHGNIEVNAVGDLPVFEATLPDTIKDVEIRVSTFGGAKVSLESYQISKKN